MNNIQFGETSELMQDQDGKDLVQATNRFGEAITALKGVEYEDTPDLLKELIRVLAFDGIDVPPEMPEFIRYYHLAEIRMISGFPWNATLLVIDRNDIYSWWIDSMASTRNTTTFMGKKRLKL